MILTPDQWAYRYLAVVSKVHDGDTIQANVDLGFNVWCYGVWLRLDGYNAPEVTGPQKADGQKARTYLMELIGSGPVYIQTAKTVVRSMERYVAQAFVVDSLGGLVSVAEAMAAAGFDVPRPAK